MTKKLLNPFKDQGMFWMGFLIAAIALLWLLSDVLAPFVTGLVVAYMLNPIVSNLSKNVPRYVASLVVLLLFFLLVALIVVLVSPVIANQATDFFNDLPKYVAHMKDATAPYTAKLMQYLSEEDVQKIQDAMGSYAGSILKGTRQVVMRVWSGGMAVIDLVTFLIITPVVAFYFMRDWKNIVSQVDELFPRRSADVFRQMLGEFDMRLSGFLRGQVMVCTFLGVFYGLALSIVGLNFGLAIGAITGVLSFIPYVGSTLGLISSVGVALVQGDDYSLALIVLAIFVIGQFIEGNFLTPNLVGKRIGLHAVWVIFALMAGGKLLGFTGMLLAVPLAAMIGVIVRYTLIWYKQSDVYKGA
jgi:predicted PurR-regulated permease PerM